MNIAIILAGGNASRMKAIDVPKQYLMVSDKPVISYCLATFQKHKNIDAIIIVAKEEWHQFLNEWLTKENIHKFKGFAMPGKSRQHSIYNGLCYAKQIVNKEIKEDEIVIIHDAARPLVSERIITDCIHGATTSDGAMPVIKVKDTIYRSLEGKHIEGLLNRDELYAGQAPESFKLNSYLSIHERLSDEEIGAIRGSSEIAYKYGMKIELIEGSEDNFKITTMEDLEKFKLLVGSEEL
ncbi:IspD/TarI family cytidylyltransferase [Anaerosporobacter faecicola]|uniref:IspD/TarI family cytidylyltransferase n=1 Tax=Anaerosporobacter faecicola TaxID=2718714 RepID=UPI00143B73C9|nr:IspD/TarI family cytidylyltransferase [Anaerosporobacter faecicola]